MQSPRPFRGRQARDAGLVTRGVLAGPTTRRLFPDVHVAVEAPDDLRTRAIAASLLVPGAVVGGHAAAELLDASCGPVDAAVDLIVGRHRTRSRPGLRVRQDVLGDDEVVEVDGVRVTTARRTAFDLACRLEHVEAVVAVDALARVGRFAAEELLALRPGARGTRRLPRVVAAVDPRAESPPETRTRLALVAQGVPLPDLQVEVFDAHGIFAGRVDMGWRRARVGVEYQGDHHRTDMVQWRRDQARLADLAAAGWLIIPATARTLRRPDVLAEQVMGALADRSR
ncbi:hypothetical protein [Actinomycetospora cinnamomea]|uniref:hypothetical protein n=1 Tax=Actinomycetospora cinnamomea TaxID=663609 RepID=UPI0010579C9B|nr:hypothetical protein [Actinomycetospora cinnamomea]